MAKKENIRIGEVLKRARERKGLRAEDVAALCNVSRSRVYQWEAADFILRKNFAAISVALGISIRYLDRVNGERGERDPVAA